MAKVNDMLADYFRTCGEYDHFIEKYGDVQWVSLHSDNVEYSFTAFLERGTLTTAAQYSEIQSWLWSKLK